MQSLAWPRAVLRLLADPSLHFSNYLCKPRVVRVESDYSETIIAHVQQGVVGELVDSGMMRYVGWYELTDKGKAECARLAALDSKTAKGK